MLEYSLWWCLRVWCQSQSYSPLPSSMFRLLISVSKINSPNVLLWSRSSILHWQVYVLRKVLEKQPRNINRVYSLVTDHFDLCLTKCRTSSNSVVHENSYKDSSNKYCYGYNEKRKDVNVNKGKHKIHRLHLWHVSPIPFVVFVLLEISLLRGYDVQILFNCLMLCLPKCAFSHILYTQHGSVWEQSFHLC